MIDVAIFCGMLRAADEGIANITILLQDNNLLDDMIIIFTTDNGGQTAKGIGKECSYAWW